MYTLECSVHCTIPSVWLVGSALSAGTYEETGAGAGGITQHCGDGITPSVKMVVLINTVVVMVLHHQ